MSSWPGIALVLGLVGSTLVLLRLYQQRRHPPAERIRKIFHMVGAAIGLALPWLFDRVWPVAFLGGVALLGLVMVRCSRRLRAGVGSLIHAVERRSFGDLCFPPAVCLVFALADGNRLRVAIGLLPLMLADPAASFVGLRYGRLRYRIPGGTKSVEGSAAFFAVAFGCLVGLHVGAGLGLPLVAAIAVALALTVVEALAPRGLDNLLVPLAALLAVDAWMVGNATLFRVLSE